MVLAFFLLMFAIVRCPQHSAMQQQNNQIVNISTIFLFLVAILCATS